MVLDVTGAWTHAVEEQRRREMGERRSLMLDEPERGG